MTIALLTKNIWRTLTAATQTRTKPAVAVAYFGQGAAGLLPLPSGSRLVVDASEGAVKSGQTCPAEFTPARRSAWRDPPATPRSWSMIVEVE
jgi:hypothetical protein